VAAGRRPLGAALEQRQDAAGKPLLQAADPRATHDDGAVAQGQPAGLAVAVAIARLRVHRRAPFGAPPAEQLVDLLLQDLLEELLHALSGKIFQRFPGGD